MPSLFSYEEHVWVGGGKPEIEDMDYFVEKSEVCFAFARTAKFNGTPLLPLARKLRLSLNVWSVTGIAGFNPTNLY